MDQQAYLKQARAKAAKYCAGRERAPFQVLEKLLSWELSEEDAQKILGELVSELFVDEQRFCNAFCHDKFEFNQWGKNRIRQELHRYRLPAEVIENGLSVIDPEKYQRILRNLAQKKWKGLTDAKWPKSQKTAAYLVRKGFETDLVMEIVKEMSEGEHS